MAFLECTKNLIDNFDDFGQFAADDEPDTEKPISPYAKFFDECSLSTVQSVSVKEYEPFGSNSNLGWNNMIRWLGDSSDSTDDECYPKNIIRLIYLWEKGLGSAGYRSTEIDALIVEDKQNGGSFLTNYIEPYLNIAVHKALSYMLERSNEFKPNTEDGRYEMYSL